MPSGVVVAALTCIVPKVQNYTVDTRGLPEARGCDLRGDKLTTNVLHWTRCGVPGESRERVLVRTCVRASDGKDLGGSRERPDARACASMTTFCGG